MASSAQVATGNSRKGQKNRNLVPPLEEGATESAKKRRVRLRENLSKRAKRAEKALLEARKHELETLKVIMGRGE